MRKKLPAVTDTVEKRVALAKSFIETNYSNDLSLNDIATSAHLSKAHLTRKFKEIFGVTPYQHLINTRLLEAERLLLSTDLPVNDIVSSIGFYSSSSFIRMFKEKHSITPMVFRKPKKKKGTI